MPANSSLLILIPRHTETEEVSQTRRSSESKLMRLTLYRTGTFCFNIDSTFLTSSACRKMDCKRREDIRNTLGRRVGAYILWYGGTLQCHYLDNLHPLCIFIQKFQKHLPIEKDIQNQTNYFQKKGTFTPLEHQNKKVQKAKQILCSLIELTSFPGT